MSCQNSQPFMVATRRLMRETSSPSMRPEESSPAHIARAPRKILGRLAYNRWFKSGAPHFLIWASKVAFIGPRARSGSTPSILASALPPLFGHAPIRPSCAYDGRCCRTSPLLVRFVSTPWLLHAPFGSCTHRERFIEPVESALVEEPASPDLAVIARPFGVHEADQLLRAR